MTSANDSRPLRSHSASALQPGCQRAIKPSQRAGRSHNGPQSRRAGLGRYYSKRTRPARPTWGVSGGRIFVFLDHPHEQARWRRRRAGWRGRIPLTAPHTTRRHRALQVSDGVMGLVCRVPAPAVRRHPSLDTAGHADKGTGSVLIRGAAAGSSPGREAGVFTSHKTRKPRRGDTQTSLASGAALRLPCAAAPRLRRASRESPTHGLRRGLFPTEPPALRKIRMPRFPVRLEISAAERALLGRRASQGR